MKVSNFILILVGITLAVFTIAMIVIYCLTDGIPDTLVTCVFAFCGGECGVLGWIKTAKVKHSDSEVVDDDSVG